MGLSLERKTLLSCHSERVKAVDFHPTEPWVLSALYNGTVTIRNYQTNVLVKTIEVCDLPVRTVKFIARKNWIVVGSDDLMIRVFNYNTLERVTQFTAHSDYIRALIIHPTRPVVLSCSDDMSVKAWDWEKSWKHVATFEGHSHYVMGMALNPKDSNTFATASLDKTIKIWSLSALISASSSSSNSSSGPVVVKPNYTMGDGGHEKGINCIDFYGGSDRPFLVTGSDDQTVRIWDYHTKSCVRVLEGHTNNVSAVMFHPQLPFLLSAGEDSTLRIWNAQTFRPEASYNFGMERAWGLACCRAHNAIGIAFDSGSIVFQLGRGDPCASLDPIQGRLVWSRARGSGSAGSHGNEILTGMVRLLDVEGRTIRVPADSEIIPLTPKELGTSDVFPQNLQHSPDGRLVAVWGDGEYVIYSTIGWRNRAFGRGAEIAWASPGGDVFAARDPNGRVMINRVSAHDQGIPLSGVTDCDKIFGGPLLGTSTGGSTLSFFDWSGEHLIRTIDVVATSVSWSPDCSHVAIQTDGGSCYILSAKAAVLRSPQSFPSGEEGIEDALELVDEIEQPLKSVCWISGNCFVYLTEENRLAYHVVGGDADESFQLALFDRSHFLLGFLPSEQRVYLTDQDLQVTSYAILPSLITFQSSVLSGGQLNLDLLKSIPSTYYARLAVFLQRRGYLREALEISPDSHFQFNLAVELGDLQLARELLQTKMSGEQEKWQELGRVALKLWNLPIAEESLTRAGDLPSLFLLYAAAGDVDGLLSVARSAVKKPGHVNLAFAAFVKAGAYVSAFELLLSEGRSAEAALFARTYGLGVELVGKAVEGWKESLKRCKGKDRVSESIADPRVNPELFGENRFGVAGLGSSGGTSGGRARSVSFDGNVSVAGSSSTISLKRPEDETVSSEVSSVNVTTGGVAFATGVLDESTAEMFSDDQMSLEVNTAGTGTRLEDLDEEDLNEVDGEFGEPDYEASIADDKTDIIEPVIVEMDTTDDPLIEELENLQVEESEAVLGVVEGGADVYDVQEAEYSTEEQGNDESQAHETVESEPVVEAAVLECENDGTGFEYPDDEVINYGGEGYEYPAGDYANEPELKGNYANNEPECNYANELEGAYAAEPKGDYANEPELKGNYVNEPIVEGAYVNEPIVEGTFASEPIVDNYEAEHTEGAYDNEPEISYPSEPVDNYHTEITEGAYANEPVEAYETTFVNEPTDIYSSEPAEISHVNEPSYDYPTETTFANEPVDSFDYPTESAYEYTDDNVVVGDEFEHYAEDNFQSSVPKEKLSEAEDEDENVHEEIDFGGDGEVDAWL